MSQATLTSSPAPTPALSTDPGQPLSFDQLGRLVATSMAIAWGMVAGLPALGVLAALLAGLPFFAAVMAGCFLLSVGLIGRKALVTFTGRTLQLLVAARFTVVVIVGALLFATTGSTQTALVSAVLLWLAADRLLGRRALHDLWKLVTSRR